jgi:4-amino-4-deoxy-L-arabinose transferase-like glycosyltransferase
VLLTAILVAAGVALTAYGTLVLLPLHAKTADQSPAALQPAVGSGQPTATVPGSPPVASELVSIALVRIKGTALQRAGLLIAAVVLASVAQYQLAQQVVSLWQLAAYIVAGALFAVAVPEEALRTRAVSARVPADGVVIKPKALFRRINLGAILAAFAFVLVMFWNNQQREFCFYLWVGILVWYVVSFAYPFGELREHSLGGRQDLPGEVYWPLFAAIVAAVAIISLFRLDNIPFGVWFDEASFSLYAQHIVGQQANWPIITPFSEPTSSSTGPAALQVYFHAVTQQLFGSVAAATRVVSAVSGILSVALMGVLASTIWNRKLGLLSMVILGSMRWHLDFSRIGMNEMVFVCFELAVAVTLTLALTYRRPVWFAAAGVFAGLTMHIYQPSIAVTGMVIVTLVYALFGRPRLRPALAGLALMGFVLAYGPLLEAGIQDPSSYSGRAETVSIFSSANTSPPLQALKNNLEAHFFMFNVQGDKNGRHNIPGQPQLDQISALLFVLGVGWTIRHMRRPVYAGLLLWFFAMMLPGILSLDFEAPQSARVVGAQVPVALFIAIALYGAAWTVYGAVEKLRSLSWAKLAVPSLAVLLATQLASTNVSAYYDAETNNESVWESYSTDATAVGRELARLPVSEPALASPDLAGTPSMIFLSPPGRAPVAPFVPAVNLPVVGHAPTAVFLSRNDDAYWSLVDAYYPRAKVRLVRGPNPATEPLVYEARLSRADLTAISGLNLASADHPVHPRQVVDHGGRFLGPAVAGDVLWWGGIHVQQYQRAGLTFRAPGFITVQIDRRPPCSGMRSVTCSQVWPQGNHSVAVRVTRTGRSQGSSLSWAWTGRGRVEFFTSSLTTYGLVARYYANATWAGQPVIARVEPDIFYYYQYLDSLTAPWSGRWSGQIFIPKAGVYRFSLVSIDGSSISIDGRRVLRSVHFPTAAVSSVSLRKGWHKFGARLRAVSRGFRIYLTWVPAGSGAATPVPIPASNFRP